MDALPFAFCDAVGGHLYWRCLTFLADLSKCCWSYVGAINGYSLYLNWKARNGNIEWNYLFYNSSSPGFQSVEDLQRANRALIRVYEIFVFDHHTTQVHFGETPTWRRVSEDEIIQNLLKFVLSLSDHQSRRLSLSFRSNLANNFVSRCMEQYHGRNLHFEELVLRHYGARSEEFLVEQLEKGLVESVQVTGDEWPPEIIRRVTSHNMSRHHKKKS